MSKITAKNLSYSRAPPPFLAALQAQASGQAGPDPIIAGRKRSTKKRSASEEAEDEPLVVDEHGNVVDLDEKGEEEEGKDPQEQTHAKEDDGRDDKRDVKNSMIGGRRKKVGKVVGQLPQPHEEEEETKDRHDTKKTASSDRPVVESSASQKPLQKKKKAKKIKLSFDDQEDEV